MLSAYYNSRLSEYHSPLGAVQPGQEVTVKIKVNAESCSLILDSQILPMQAANGFFTVTFKPQTTDLVWYYFAFRYENKTYYYGNNPGGLGGEGAVSEVIPPAYQITVYQTNHVPAWFKNGIIYQIYPDRFFRGKDFSKRIMTLTKAKNGPQNLLHLNWQDQPFYLKDEQGDVTHWDFFGGTLLGIEEKLDYLQQLGVTILYLNPIFQASSNHKYDTGDYLVIDPAYGDEESFAKLIHAAQKRSMKVIIDGVFNHTGCDSKYFNKYGNYPGLGAYQDHDSPYYSWYDFQQYPEEYQCWWGVKDLPAVTETNNNYLNFILSVMDHWQKLGIAGWRLDVIDELPLPFLAALKQKAEANNLLLLGEVWEDASHKVTYGETRNYFRGDLIDSVMNYPFREQVIQFLTGQINAKTVVNHYHSLAENYPKDSFYALANLLGSHDTERILTVLGSNVKKAVYWQMCMPGVPYIYYGDEVGLTGGKDPDNRQTYPWGQENQEIFHLYSEAIKLRKQYELLTDGDFSCTSLDNALLITRTKQDEKITLILNQNQEELILDNTQILAVDLETGQIIDRQIVVPANSMRIVYQSNQSSPLKNKAIGVLLPVSSLDGFSQKAEQLVDILAANKITLWQILPLNPVDSFHSPYSSCSVFAYEEAYLQKKAIAGDYTAFCQENSFWLDDYCFYQALKKHFGKPWYLWEKPLKNRESEALAIYKKVLAEDIKLNRFMQHLAYLQWHDIKKYANTAGVEIIGDLPFYVNYDSCDCWVNPQLFNFAAQGGAPPDDFNPQGQNWGMPTYNWQEMEKQDFSWWKLRVKKALLDYDYFRLDHFRGLESYWQIEKTAKQVNLSTVPNQSLVAVPSNESKQMGAWHQGPGKKLLDSLYQEFPNLPMIVEDLGFITADVQKLRNCFNLPTMAVYQFSPNLETLTENTVLYSSTHDSMPLAGWHQNSGDVCRQIVASKAQWVIFPLQDLLGLGAESRMNTPGTTENNWQWKIEDLADLQKKITAYHQSVLAAQTGLDD